MAPLMDPMAQHKRFNLRMISGCDGFVAREGQQFWTPKWWRPLGWKMIFRISIGSDFWGEPVEPAVHFLGCLGQKNDPPIYLEFYRCCLRRWFCLRLTIQKSRKWVPKKPAESFGFWARNPPPKKKSATKTHLFDQTPFDKLKRHTTKNHPTHPLVFFFKRFLREKHGRAPPFKVIFTLQTFMCNTL